MSTATSQLNIRIPSQLKRAAQKAAEHKGVKLNTLLNIFLTTFVANPHVVTIKHDIAMEEIFDRGFTQAVTSNHGKKTLRKINKLLKTV